MKFGVYRFITAVMKGLCRCRKSVNKKVKKKSASYKLNDTFSLLHTLLLMFLMWDLLNLSKKEICQTDIFFNFRIVLTQHFSVPNQTVISTPKKNADMHLQDSKNKRCIKRLIEVSGRAVSRLPATCAPALLPVAGAELCTTHLVCFILNPSAESNAKANTNLSWLILSANRIISQLPVNMNVGLVGSAGRETQTVHTRHLGILFISVTTAFHRQDSYSLWIDRTMYGTTATIQCLVMGLCFRRKTLQHSLIHEEKITLNVNFPNQCSPFVYYRTSLQHGIERQYMRTRDQIRWVVNESEATSMLKRTRKCSFLLF